MKVNCLSCGHQVELDDAYEEYEGPVKCWVCGSLLVIKSEGGRLRSVRPASASADTTPGRVQENHAAGGSAPEGATRLP